MSELAHEVEVEGAPAPPYGNIYDRAETIRALIIDGALDPLDGIWLLVYPSEEMVAAERARHEADARTARHRYSVAARERAVALVAGGASCRMAAASVLGDERLRTTVWRWARKQGVL